jgi:hypothetical protein
VKHEKSNRGEGEGLKRDERARERERGKEGVKERNEEGQRGAKERGQRDKIIIKRTFYKTWISRVHTHTAKGSAYLQKYT